MSEEMKNEELEFLVDDVTGLEPRSIELRKAGEEADKQMIRDLLGQAERYARTPITEDSLLADTLDSDAIRDAVLGTYNGMPLSDYEERRNRMADRFEDSQREHGSTGAARVLNFYMEQELPKLVYIKTFREMARLNTLLNTAMRMMQAGLSDEVITSCTGITQEQLNEIRRSGDQPDPFPNSDLELGLLETVLWTRHDGSHTSASVPAVPDHHTVRQWFPLTILRCFHFRCLPNPSSLCHQNISELRPGTSWLPYRSGSSGTRSRGEQEARADRFSCTRSW